MNDFPQERFGALSYSWKQLLQWIALVIYHFAWNCLISFKKLITKLSHPYAHWWIGTFPILLVCNLKINFAFLASTIFFPPRIRFLSCVGGKQFNNVVFPFVRFSWSLHKWKTFRNAAIIKLKFLVPVMNGKTIANSRGRKRNTKNWEFGKQRKKIKFLKK